MYQEKLKKKGTGIPYLWNINNVCPRLAHRPTENNSENEEFDVWTDRIENIQRPIVDVPVHANSKEIGEAG